MNHATPFFHWKKIINTKDLALLYLAPWVKKCSDKNSARCRCDSFLFIAFVL
jgi:hypothetical protein